MSKRRRITRSRCSLCRGKSNVLPVHPMIGWGRGFQGFGKVILWCYKCRNKHHGHWRWHNPVDAICAAIYRRFLSNRVKLLRTKRR